MKAHVHTKTCVRISVAEFFRTAKTQETAQVSISKRMGKQAVIYLYNGRWLRNKRNVPLRHAITWMHLKNIIWVKEACLNENLLSDSIYKVLQQSKLVSNDRNQDNGYLWGVGRCGDWLRRSMREGSGVMEMFCVLINACISMVSLVKTHQWVLLRFVHFTVLNFISK